MNTEKKLDNSFSSTPNLNTQSNQKISNSYSTIPSAKLLKLNKDEILETPKNKINFLTNTSSGSKGDPLLPKITTIKKKVQKNKFNKFWKFKKNKEETNIVENIYLTSTGLKQKINDFVNSEFIRHKKERYDQIKKSQSYVSLLEKSKYMKKKSNGGFKKNLYFLDKEGMETDLRKKQYESLSDNRKFKGVVNNIFARFRGKNFRVFFLNIFFNFKRRNLGTHFVRN